MNKRIYEVLLGPIASEKAAALEEKENSFAFWVLPDATKKEIRTAVEVLFKVSVHAVHTIRLRPEVRVVGRHKRPGKWRKKAYVKLHAGHVIQLAGEQ
jgi:large subunit ribosomal protein L23